MSFLTKNARPDAARLKICFCNSNKAWGGGELWHLTFARELRARGHETCVLVAKDGVLAEKARQAGLDVTAMPLGRLSFLNYLRMRDLCAFFRKKKPDVVLLGLPQDFKAAGQAARFTKVPLILYRRGMGLPVRDRWFNRHLFRGVAHGVIVNALDSRRALLSENPELLPHERIHLLYNGVDDALLQRPLAPLEGPGPCIVGTAGRLVEQKGHEYLLRAAALLLKRGVDFELRIAGDGPLREKLTALAASLGLKERVRFLGFVEDMRGFYESLHVFAFPSLWEGMGNAVLEAMAAGRPVVGFAVSSMPEVVLDGESGFLAPLKDVEAFASAVERLCLEPELRVRMGSAGRERVVAEFRLQEQVSLLERLLLELLKKGTIV